VEPNDEYEVIWNTSDFRIENNKNRPMLVGAPGRIIVQGWKSGDVFLVTIAALDSMSGEIVWQIQEGHDGYQLIAHDNVLYRGIIGSAAVQSFSIEDGELLWRTPLPWGHSVSDLYFAENKIFVYTNNDLFFLLNERGDILETIHTTDRMFLKKNGVLYMEDVYSIKAVDLSTKNELWRLELDYDNRYTYAPIFDDGTIFLMTWADIYSIDQPTGEVEWKLSQDVLSNLCILGDKIYFISHDGYLVAINRYSGTEISKVKFSPPLDSENNNNQ
jgi:outer membrane protein assembly factor BamB